MYFVQAAWYAEENVECVYVFVYECWVEPVLCEQTEGGRNFWHKNITLITRGLIKSSHPCLLSRHIERRTPLPSLPPSPPKRWCVSCLISKPVNH